ncbi:MAG: hypothetical protein ACNS60_08005 [Candidatus Cyclobacteriaceae bacterium M2_1C_046]|uniref:Uncharacterized protein n=1 Tax=Marivirga lumbricoides TaxID=1046115 RepID=A0A2T4DGM6_9BACT|nr:hypothetical protein C9994_13500 [Marivirga lumbricoides]
MKVDLDKLYVVYKPTRHSEKADVFDGRTDTLAGLFRQVLGGLKVEQVHAIFTTSAEAEKEANLLLKKPSRKKGKAKPPIKRGQGHAIFGSEVKASDKYRVQSKPKVYRTKKEAESALKQMLRKGWKRSELKILKY